MEGKPIKGEILIKESSEGLKKSEELLKNVKKELTNIKTINKNISNIAKNIKKGDTKATIESVKNLEKNVKKVPYAKLLNIAKTLKWFGIGFLGITAVVIILRIINEELKKRDEEKNLN